MRNASTASKKQAKLVKNWAVSLTELAMICLMGQDDVDDAREEDDLDPDFVQSCNQALQANRRKLALALRMMGRDWCLEFEDEDVDVGAKETDWWTKRLDTIIQKIAEQKPKAAVPFLIEQSREYADQFAG
jgi:hypothetical protein